MVSPLFTKYANVITDSISVFTLRAFSRRRIQFREFIASNTSLTVNRYFRLSALAMTDLLCTVPFAIYLLYLNASSGQVEAHYSWTAVHWQYSQIFQVPSLIWRSDPSVMVAMELSRWLSVVCGFIFFAFFGFADEARKQYISAFWFVAKRIGFQRSSSKSFFEKCVVLMFAATLHHLLINFTYFPDHTKAVCLAAQVQYPFSYRTS